MYTTIYIYLELKRQVNEHIFKIVIIFLYQFVIKPEMLNFLKDVN